ncbi:MAG: VCBS repeat-containing protein [Deltaproteobacteria bacterium]|nr:VCBS repeat-containing protein [Deltaproteobacteria bacterium]
MKPSLLAGISLIGLLASGCFVQRTAYSYTSAQGDGAQADTATSPDGERAEGGAMMDGGEGGPGDVADVIEEPLPPLPTPRLIAPLTSSVVPSSRVRFRYTVPGDTHVQLQVCADAQCATELVQYRTVRPVTSGDNAIDVPLTEMPVRTLFWRVCAVRLDGDGGVIASDAGMGDAGDGGGMSTSHCSAIWAVRPASDVSSGPASSVVLSTLSDVHGSVAGDLAVSALQTGGTRGLVYLYSALDRAGGPMTIPDPRHTDCAPMAPCDAMDAPLGSSVAMLGDVDGDGFAEVAALGSGDTNLGRVLIFSGKPTPAVGDRGPLRVLGTLSGDTSNRLTRSVMAAGDVDGDGVPDLLVIARSTDGSLTEEIWVYLGQREVGAPPFTTARRVRILPGMVDLVVAQAFGQRVIAGRDLNRDGYADILVGMPDLTPTVTTGTVAVYLGGPAFAPGAIIPPSTMSLALPAATATMFGSQLAFGDVNGDGDADVIAAYVDGVVSPNPQYAIYRGGPMFSTTAGVYARTGVVANSTGVVLNTLAGVGDIDTPTVGPGVEPNYDAEIVLYRNGGTAISKLSLDRTAMVPSFTRQDIALGLTASSITFARVAGDVSGDRRADIVVSDTLSAVRVLRWNEAAMPPAMTLLALLEMPEMGTNFGRSFALAPPSSPRLRRLRELFARPLARRPLAMLH